MPTLMNGNNFLLKRRKSTNTLQITYFCRNLNKPEMTKRPLILVTNDDGITAPGIRTLIKVMNTIGDVVVVAPVKITDPETEFKRFVSSKALLILKK